MMSLKRALDITLSGLALILFSPVLALVGACVAVFLGTPVLFRQKRPGLHGQPFTLYKFRTMLDATDSSGKPLPDHLRLTKFGKFLRSTSLDELPEFLNVLKGEMSLVGPRPLLMEYLPRYTREQARRHDVRPGITGWAQINGRNSLSWDEKFRMDVWYVDHRSLWLDFKILWKTVIKVIARDGISSEGHATMTEFKTKIRVIGAGGHAKVVISAIRATGQEVEGLYDDNQALWGKEILGVPVLGGIDKAAEQPTHPAVLAIGDNRAREKLAARLKLNWVSVIHPQAWIAPTAVVGEGSVVFAGAVIQPDTRIGKHCIVNTGATVDHDCRVGDFVHIAPGANLCGNATIGEGALLSVGCRLIPGAKIGAWSVVAAGAAVTREVAQGARVGGVPARALAAAPGAVSVFPKSASPSPSSSSERVPMASAEINEQDVEAVVRVVRSGRLALGPEVLEFEKAMAAYVGVKHAIAVNSGTAALHLIVKSMGFQKGDEILVPSYTFAASVNALLFEELVPVFVDIDPETYNLDVKDMERKAGPRCKGVMVVDVFGHPAPWTEIEKFCRARGLKIIDDSCEALGAEIGGRKIGSFGDAAAFAFYPNKQITTGEGGIIVTNDDTIARLCRSYRNQGRDEMGQWLEHVRLGYNYRMDEMSAALGRSQLSRIDQFIASRARVASEYTSRLSRFGWAKPPVVKSGAKMSWFVYVVTLDQSLDRDEVIRMLQARGIPARAYFSPIHKQAYLMDVPQRGGESLPVTESVSSRTLALPFFNQMTAEQVETVVRELQAVAEECLGRRKKAA